MRRLLIALPFALLPLAAAHAHDDHEHEHGSLGAHEHGVAQLNVALDGQALEVELQSPAMNLVGFEHAATSDADKAKVATVRKTLEQPLALFNLPTAAGCELTEHELESPLFGDAPRDDDHDHGKADAHHHEHSDVHAHYQFTCATPAALTQLGLAGLFKTFPATQKVQLQLIAPSGQQGLELTPAASTVKF
jgi:hypothetical protein